MCNKRIKNKIKKTARLMFPEIPKEFWTMIIHEWEDNDFTIRYYHGKKNARQSLLFDFYDNTLVLYLYEESIYLFNIK